MTKTKQIKMDLSTIKGVMKAEKAKTRLENAGYNKISSQQIGLDKWIDTWAIINN